MTVEIVIVLIVVIILSLFNWYQSHIANKLLRLYKLEAELNGKKYDYLFERFKNDMTPEDFDILMVIMDEYEKKQGLKK